MRKENKWEEKERKEEIKKRNRHKRWNAEMNEMANLKIQEKDNFEKCECQKRKKKSAKVTHKLNIN